ncbi:MAG TPA: DUF58 domain-containing protein [Dongiaceae bacterium]|nr:DUF58 domain-containing protein [Dongiaceae bacterium]
MTGGSRGILYPSRRAVWLIASAIPPALLFGILAPLYWPAGAAYLGAILALLLVDAVLTLRDIAVALPPTSLLQIGQPADFSVTLTSAASSSATRVKLEAAMDIDDLVAPEPAQLLLYRPGTMIAVHFALQPKRRGTARLRRVWLRWSSPFGLAWRRKIVTVDRDLHILTNTARVQQEAVRFLSQDNSFGEHIQRDNGNGSEFEALRDYAPGLDRRTIDWKHSARHRRLVSKEFHAERNNQVILAIDSGHLMREPLALTPKLDHAVTAALMLAYTSLKSGDRVGLYAFDSRPRLFAAPNGGIGTFARLQHLASEIDYSAEETNFTLGLSRLAGDLPRRSLIILITDFVDTVTAELMVENIGRLAKRHLVLFVTFTDPVLNATITRPASDMTDMAKTIVAAELARDRQILFRRLNRLGVQCLEARHDGLGSEMINRYLDIRQRELI